MKKLRKNKGFTLVECVVAMAVLAIMTLGLLMILGVTVRQRNQNTQIERDVDRQVEQVIRQNDGKYDDVDDIDLGGGITISGVQKIYFDEDGSDLQIGALYYDDDDIIITPPAADPNPDKNNNNNQVAGNRYKVYGTARLDKNQITVAQQGAYTDNGDGTYTVTWRISFSSYGEGNDTTLVDVVNMGAVKVVFPDTTKPIAYSIYSGTVKHVYYLGDNTIRIEPGVYAKDALNSITVDIDFIISASDYKASLITDYFGSATPEINKAST